MQGRLAAERRTLKRILPELLLTSRNRFVLIHGAAVIGSFDTENEALRAGYRTFGPHGVFLIDQVGSEDRPRPVTYLLDHRD